MHKRIDRPYGDGWTSPGVLPYFAAVPAGRRGSLLRDQRDRLQRRGDRRQRRRVPVAQRRVLRRRNCSPSCGQAPGQGSAASSAAISTRAATPSAACRSAPFTFNRNFTSSTPTAANPATAAGGNAFASFLLGYPAFNATNVKPAVRRPRSTHRRTHWRGNYYAGFIQDDWRVTERLDRQRSGCAGTTRRRSRNGTT